MKKTHFILEGDSDVVTGRVEGDREEGVASVVAVETCCFFIERQDLGYLAAESEVVSHA